MISTATTRMARALLASSALLALGPALAQEIPLSAKNWTEKVGFAPELTPPGFQKGATLENSNLAGREGLVPEALRQIVQRYGLKMQMRDYEPVAPSAGYIEATRVHWGKPRLVDIGQAVNRRGIDGYVAGLPFPDPKDGLQVAWNFHCSHGGDDADSIYSVHWISAQQGLEHSEEWRLSAIRGDQRTDLDPRPAIPEFQKKRIAGAGLTYALSPYDKKGFGAVYYRSLDPKDSQGHIYVPSMRRVLQNAFGTRGDTWNATDLLYEDVRGYSGYPEWMNWKLLARKTVLLPMHSGVIAGKENLEKSYDLKSPPHWNPLYQYEPRPVYVLEATPKLKDYPYSRQILYVDAEVYAILYKESYDKKGALWKVMLNAAGYHPDASLHKPVLGWIGTVVLDLQAEHATLFHVHKAVINSGLSPSLFSIATLRKRGT